MGSPVLTAFECTLCTGRFCTASELRVHVRSHSGEKPFECSDCSHRFTTSSGLMDHKRRVHDGERAFECPTCSKRFKTAGDLKKHERVHSGEKPFECTHCNMRFSLSSNLRRHLKVHSGDKVLHEWSILVLEVQRANHNLKIYFSWINIILISRDFLFGFGWLISCYAYD